LGGRGAAFAARLAAGLAFAAGLRADFGSSAAFGLALFFADFASAAVIRS
jgi:hypothetical protein